MRKKPDMSLNDSFQWNQYSNLPTVQNATNKALFFSTQPQKHTPQHKIPIKKWTGFGIPHFSYSGTVAIEKTPRENTQTECETLDKILDSDIPITSGAIDMRVTDANSTQRTNRSKFEQERNKK